MTAAGDLSRHLLRNKPALAALVILSLVLILALAAPWVAFSDPVRIDLDQIKQPPGMDHPFGTDSKGRDIFSRVLYGARLSLSVGVTAAAISVLIGLISGLSAGYFGGRLDMLFTIGLDVMLAFPSLLLVIAIGVVLPPGLVPATLALSLVGWAVFARLFRGMAYSLKTQAYVEAARASGASHMRILLRHLLPNCLPLTGVVLMMKIGGFILAESALSFLGLGAQPPTPSWGSMINLDRIYIHSAPWMVVFPGMAITVTVTAFNILGDFLRDYWDPKMKV